MVSSLKTRWILSISLSVLLSLIVSGILSLWVSQNDMQETLLEQSKQEMESKKKLVAKSVLSYFENIEKLILDKAADPEIIEASEVFNSSFQLYREQRKLTPDEAKRDVKSFYEKTFIAEFDKHNNVSTDPLALLAKIDPIEQIFQSDYIANNGNPLGSKHLLEAKQLSNDYDRAHKKYHTFMRRFIELYQFYDAFIVDAQTGSIVYSVFKEVDFATNLKNGPFSNTGIAEAFREANKLPFGKAYLTDFAPYLPSYNAPASFIGTPIFDGSKRVGVLILQMPINVINDLLTQNQQWKENGFGETGEIYLIGGDKTLRNESRFYLESPQQYLEQLSKTDSALAEEIMIKETTIGLQIVNSKASLAALSGEQGFSMLEDYRGETVLSSYSPITILGLNWAIIAEIDKNEVFIPSANLFNKLLGSTIVLSIVLAVLFSAIAWIMAVKLIKPLEQIGEQFYDLNQGDASLQARVEVSQIKEIGLIGQQFNKFIQHIQEVIDEVGMSAQTIASASEELSVTTEHASSASQIQKERAKEVKAAVDELNRSISTVSEDTKSVAANMLTTEEKIAKNNERSDQAAADITALVSDVNESAKTIGDLKAQVESINEVVTVINSIAEQTNLLALNAAIEAARAGEHGRGFSVVADEVRTLASRTQVSTVDIQNKISSLSSIAENAVQVMQRASESANKGIELVMSVSTSLDEVDSEIKESTLVNGKIAQATVLQKTNSDDVAVNMDGINASAADLSKASQEIQQATRGLSEIASSLQTLVQKFN